MNTQTYSGTLISDLYAKVDNALALRSSSVDSAEPWTILKNARLHVADAMAAATPQETSALVNAYFDLGEIEWCLMQDLTRSCRNCHQMEGLHWALGYCRKQSMNGDQRLSQRFEAE